MGQRVHGSVFVFIQKKYQIKDMMLFGKVKGLDLKWLSCSESERKIPVAWSPVLFPGRGKTRL